MALLWFDGFDHYGGDNGKLADGAWAQVDTSYFSLSTSVVRTGTYSLLRSSPNTSQKNCRRVLGGAKTSMGLGLAVYFTALPSANNRASMFDLRDTGNKCNLCLIVQSTGDLAVYRGDTHAGVLLATTTTPPIVAGAFQHVEMQAVFSATIGAFEVRVNGVTVLSSSGINTVASASELDDFSTGAAAECSQISLIGGDQYFVGSPSLGTYLTYYDDIYAYDLAGLYNNSWQGDRRVYTLFPDADTATADWSVVGAANPFDAINSPLSDSSYITAGIPGSPSELRSDFELEALPEVTGLVSGVALVNRVQKNEAGNADLQSGIISNSVEADGAVHPLNPAFTYHEDVFEYDPDTGASFTPEAVDALQIKISRIT